MMLYCCTHMATAGVKGLKATVLCVFGSMLDDVIVVAMFTGTAPRNSSSETATDV